MMWIWAKAALVSAMVMTAGACSADESDMPLERQLNARFGFAASYPADWVLMPPPANGDGFIARPEEGASTELIASGSHHFSMGGEDKQSDLEEMKMMRLPEPEAMRDLQVSDVMIAIQFSNGSDGARNAEIPGVRASYLDDEARPPQRTAMLFTSYCGTDYIQTINMPASADAQFQAVADRVFPEFRVLASAEDARTCPVE